MTTTSSALTRRLTLMACDSVVLAMAFWLAVKLIPILFALLIYGGMLHFARIANIAPASKAAMSALSLREFVWVFVVMCPATVVCFELFGGHRPAREQRPRRIMFASLFAPMAGVGVLTVVLFTLKHPGYSRVVVFCFALLSALFLAGGRWAAVMVYRERLQKGYLVKEVALIGAPEMLRQISATFQKAPVEYSVAGSKRGLSAMRIVLRRKICAAWSS